MICKLRYEYIAYDLKKSLSYQEKFNVLMIFYFIEKSHEF